MTPRERHITELLQAHRSGRSGVSLSPVLVTGHEVTYSPRHDGDHRPWHSIEAPGYRLRHTQVGIRRT